MMNSSQGLDSRERDIDEFIKQEKDNPNFKDMFKKIMEGGSSKKVENFLRENKEGIDFMQEIPGYLDPRTGEVIREDQQSDFMGGPQQPPIEFLSSMKPDYFGVPESVRNANKFMSGYTKRDFSDPEFIRNFKIINEFNKQV